MSIKTSTLLLILLRFHFLTRLYLYNTFEINKVRHIHADHPVFCRLPSHSGDIYCLTFGVKCGTDKIHVEENMAIDHVG